MGGAVRTSQSGPCAADALPGGLRRGIYVAFFLTGATALVFEVLWSRLFVPIFGNSPYAIGAVLCAFMAGLGIGGALGGRLADRAGNRLLWFAGIEAAIGLYALAIPAALHGVQLVAARAAAGTLGFPLFSNGVRFVLSFGVLVIPCVLMGATLPLLSRLCSDRRGMVGRRVGMLYGVNTMGSAAGCFAAGYWMIQTLGLRATNRLAAGLNLAVALALVLACAAAGRRPSAGGIIARPTSDSGPAAATDAVPAVRRLLPLVAFANGLAAIACEGLWARYLGFFTNYTYGFTNLLGVYLLGLGAGSLLYRACLGGVRRRVRLLAGVELVLGLAVFLCFALGAVLYARTIYVHVISAFTMALITVFLPALLMGIAFPLLCAAYAGGVDTVGRRVGLLYAANTAGAILGALAPTFFTIPLLGVQGSIGLFALLYWGLGGLVLVVSAGRGRRSAGPVVAGGAALLALAMALAVPHDLCVRVFLGTSPWLGRHQEVIFWQEGRTATASVVRDRVNGLKTVYINHMSEVPTAYPDMLCFKLMGAIGPLLQEDPERVLVIAFGGGVTAGTVTRFPEVDLVRVVELEPSVTHAARLLERENNNALHDPKVAITFEDGRNYLQGSPQRWPVIVCDSTHPKSADSWVLYTQEFYRSVREHLRDDGIFVQWVPAHGLKTAEYRIIARTFQSVFPHASLWVSVATDELGLHCYYTLLVGTAAPLSISVSRMERRLSQQPVAADLQRWGLGEAVDVLSTFVCAEAALRQWAGNGPVNTDDLPLTQYDTRYATTGSDFSLAALLDSLQSVEPYLAPAASPQEQARLRSRLARRLEARRRLFVKDLAGAHALAPDDPQIRISWRNFCNAAPYYRAVARYYADVPVGLVWFAEKAARLPGGQANAAALCQQALAAAPHYAPAHRLLGLVLEAQGQPGQALEHLTVALNAHPDDPETHNAIASALAALGRPADAETHYRESIRLRPGMLWAHLNLARLLSEQGRQAEAAAACRQALTLAPGHPAPHQYLGNILMLQGKYAEAASEFSAALRLAPHNEAARRRLAEARARLAPSLSTASTARH